MTDLTFDRPRIAVTGADGFVGWHVRCLARSRWGGDVVALGRDDMGDPDRLAGALADVDVVIHLAGVNRASSDEEVALANPALAGALVAGLRRTGRVVPVVFGNSIHARGDSIFGQAKREAADILRAYGADTGAPVADVLMPNLFGEHGRPFYNSVIATFCDQLAQGGQPTVVDDKPLPLLHVQRMAEVMLNLATAPENGTMDVPATTVMVSDVLDRLTSMSTDYRTGVLPDLSDPFTRDLFNTYRSATFPEQTPVHPPVHADDRGGLVEAVKAAGGQAQVFYSTTRPGYTRGQHYHLHKVERFMVLRGRGEMRLRRLFTDEVVTFAVTGDRPAFVDMPTMWVHSITNTGDDDLVTLFFADELFDPDHPDTFAEEV